MRGSVTCTHTHTRAHAWCVYLNTQAGAVGQGGHTNTNAIYPTPTPDIIPQPHTAWQEVAREGAVASILSVRSADALTQISSSPPSPSLLPPFFQLPTFLLRAHFRLLCSTLRIYVNGRMHCTTVGTHASIYTLLALALGTVRVDFLIFSLIKIFIWNI